MAQAGGSDSMQPKGTVSLIRCLIVSVAVLGSAGCVSIHTEQSFPVEQIRSIRPGVTTKQEVLAWFGPPTAMAEKGERILLPSAGNENEELRERAFADILEYFPTRHLEGSLIVYCYQYWKSDIPLVPAPIADVAEGAVTVYRLWILIDEDRGVAIDSVVRTHAPRETP